MAANAIAQFPAGSTTPDHDSPLRSRTYLLTLWIVMIIQGLALPSCAHKQNAVRPIEPEQVTGHLAGLAIPFVDNAGQTDAQVAYYASTFSGAVFVTRQGEIVYALSDNAFPPQQRGAYGALDRQLGSDFLELQCNPFELGQIRPAQIDSSRASTGWSLTECFIGGHAAPIAEQPAAARVSSFIGNDPARWQPHVAAHAEVGLGTVWPGVAVNLRAYAKQVEKVFTVQPGALPATIRMQVAGAQGLTNNADGTLTVHTGVGDVRLTRPVAYQEISGIRKPVEVAYTVNGDEYGFDVAGYDSSRPLVIDPLLQTTYLGGSDHDGAYALAVHPATGKIYVAGSTWSVDFPGTSGGAQTTNNHAVDAFIARLDASLTTLEQATYLAACRTFIASES